MRWDAGAIALAAVAVWCCGADGLPAGVLNTARQHADGNPLFRHDDAAARRQAGGGLPNGCRPLRSYTKAETSAWLKSMVQP